MNRTKATKSVLVLGHLVYMLILILIILIWIVSLGLSKWGQPRYEANSLFAPYLVVDRKTDVRLLLADKALADEQYIYGMCIYPSSTVKKGFLKIDYVNDLYYLYDADDTQVKSLKHIYGDRVIVLPALNATDEQIYLRLKEDRVESLVKSPYDMPSWGKRMWDEFRF